MEAKLPASSIPTLRQLQFLTALRAERSFVAAAEAVGVTQPTLSAGIKELETALGATLVERGRTGAVLTPAGEEAAERASRALPVLKRKYPDLRLKLREDLTARLVDALRARTLDAALIALPYTAQGIA